MGCSPKDYLYAVPKPEDQLMKLALESAALGWPAVAPNPMVACLVVHKGTVLARAYHQAFGGPHAEVNAIRALPDHTPFAECELYVTLEPCAHHGKTPPCTDLILSKGFKRVFVAVSDPNPLVNGRGIARLRENGIQVQTGILEKEARQLNKRFFTFHEKKRPYITLKWAESADGFISRMPLPQRREDNRISGEEAMRFAHQLRAEHSAILVGKNTALADDPELSTRLVQGPDPIRVLLDHDLEVPAAARIYNSRAKTLVFNRVKQGEVGQIRYIKLDGELPELEQVLAHLYRLGIQSLLVEGGLQVLQSFLEQSYFDTIYKVRNPARSFGNGLPAPVFDFGKHEPGKLGTDELYVNERPI